MPLSKWVARLESLNEVIKKIQNAKKILKLIEVMLVLVFPKLFEFYKFLLWLLTNENNIVYDLIQVGMKI